MSIRRYGSLRSLVPFGKILGRARYLGGRYSFKQNGNRVQVAGDDGELVGAARVLVCALAMEPQTLDFLVTNRECDHGKRRTRGITGRAE